jgi:hypothetical protein
MVTSSQKSFSSRFLSLLEILSRDEYMIVRIINQYNPIISHSRDSLRRREKNDKRHSLPETIEVGRLRPLHVRVSQKSTKTMG